MKTRHATAVLTQYPADCRPRAVEVLGNAGGFSGARLWRITAERGLLCLRRWPPEHPSAYRLRWIHDVLQHVHRQNFQLVPLPLTALNGQTFVEYAGQLWQL